jgi:hypothetical protein
MSQAQVAASLSHELVPHGGKRTSCLSTRDSRQTRQALRSDGYSADQLARRIRNSVAPLAHVLDS